jgi:hypothetical protein
VADSFDDVNPCNAYTQVFRNGITEATSRNLLVTRQGQKLIPCGRLTNDVIEHIRSALAFYQTLNVLPPFTAMLTLTGIDDYEFATGAERGGFYTHPVDRDDLPLPAVIVQDFGARPVDICRPCSMRSSTQQVFPNGHGKTDCRTYLESGGRCAGRFDGF